MLKQARIQDQSTAADTTIGVHSLTAALRNVATAHGILNPHTDAPYTESMLFGLGGGLGAGYILWEFKAHESANIVLGFSYRWNYPADNVARLAERIGAVVEVKETAGTKAAALALQNANLPAIVWVDKAHLPHQYLPEALKGYVPHILVVRKVTDDQVVVDDLSAAPFSVPADVFAAGRARIGSDKNRLIQLSKRKSIDLPAAIMEALSECIEYLGGDSESFNLPAWKKWSKLFTHPKDKKGWPTVFKERKGLYSTLRTVFEGIRLDDTDGYGLRSLYADFLDEAAGVVNLPALKQAARDFHATGQQLAAFADLALPDAITPMRQTKALLTERYAAYQRHDMLTVEKVSAELEQMQLTYDRAFPMEDAAVSALFEQLSTTLMTIYEAESAALDTLKSALA
jgi:hypothetical protein